MRIAPALALALALVLRPGWLAADGAHSGSDPLAPPAPPAPPSVATGTPLPLAAPPPPRASAVASRAARAPRSRAVVTSEETGLPVEGSRLTARFLHQPSTTLGAGLDGYTATRLTVEGRVARNLSRRFQLTGEITVERGTYDFDDVDAVVPGGVGSLAGDYTGLRFALGSSWSLSRTFGLVLGASVRTLWADGADIEDGVQPGFTLGVRLRIFGTTDVLFGLNATQKLEGDFEILPVFGLGGSAQSEGSRWSVEARGPGVSVIYRLTPRLSVGASFGYERRDVRLPGDDRIPDGVLREQRVPVGLELAWEPRRSSVLVLGAGVALWNQLTLLDADGEVVLRNTTDPAPYLQLEWSLRL